MFLLLILYYVFKLQNKDIKFSTFLVLKYFTCDQTLSSDQDKSGMMDWLQVIRVDQPAPGGSSLIKEGTSPFVEAFLMVNSFILQDNYVPKTDGFGADPVGIQNCIASFLHIYIF